MVQLNIPFLSEFWIQKYLRIKELIVIGVGQLLVINHLVQILGVADEASRIEISFSKFHLIVDGNNTQRANFKILFTYHRILVRQLSFGPAKSLGREHDSGVELVELLENLI
jgi:hypothetical protein